MKTRVHAFHADVHYDGHEPYSLRHQVARSCAHATRAHRATTARNALARDGEAPGAGNIGMGPEKQIRNKVRAAPACEAVSQRRTGRHRALALYPRAGLASCVPRPVDLRRESSLCQEA
jgi:hypothetical protein